VQGELVKLEKELKRQKDKDQQAQMGQDELTNSVPFKVLMNENQNRQLQNLPPTKEYLKITAQISKYKNVKGENPPVDPDAVEAEEYEREVEKKRPLNKTI